MDVHDKATRHNNMVAIRSTNTKPELVVRRIVSRLGYRYRLHYQSGCGRPDLALVGRKKAIFVHGCFWHRHRGCRYATNPATNRTFWTTKFIKNVQRDKRTQRRMMEQGWKLLVIWECETKFDATLAQRLQDFLAVQ